MESKYAVAASDGMEVKNTEEKVQRTLPMSTQGSRSLSFSGWHTEVVMGGNENEGGSLQESRSGYGEQESIEMYTKEEIQKEREVWLSEKKSMESTVVFDEFERKNSWSASKASFSG